MVRVARVVLLRQHDAPGRDEAREVVDVAARVVAGDAAAEPDHLLGAEIVAQDRSVSAAAELGVARRLAVEQALFGGEQRALAVDVDGAALEHDVAVLLTERDDGSKTAGLEPIARPARPARRRAGGSRSASSR